MARKTKAATRKAAPRKRAVNLMPAAPKHARFLVLDIDSGIVHPQYEYDRSEAEEGGQAPPEELSYTLAEAKAKLADLVDGHPNGKPLPFCIVNTADLQQVVSYTPASVVVNLGPME